MPSKLASFLRLAGVPFEGLDVTSDTCACCGWSWTR